MNTGKKDYEVTHLKFGRSFNNRKPKETDT